LNSSQMLISSFYPVKKTTDFFLDKISRKR
jgi:hypothetical protein